MEWNEPNNEMKKLDQWSVIKLTKSVGNTIENMPQVNNLGEYRLPPTQQQSDAIFGQDIVFCLSVPPHRYVWHHVLPGSSPTGT